MVQWRAAEDATCCPHFPRRRQPRAVARPKQQQQEACWRDGAEGFLCLPAPQTPPSPGGESLAAADPCVGPGGGCFERWCSVRQRLPASLPEGLTASPWGPANQSAHAAIPSSSAPAQLPRSWVILGYAFWGVGSRIHGMTGCEIACTCGETDATTCSIGHGASAIDCQATYCNTRE